MAADSDDGPACWGTEPATNDGSFGELGFVGSSPAIQRLLQLVRRIARAEANVLIRGETGTGKELVARALHYLSARRNGPFIPLNCGACPEALFANEIFGHRQGAFTDARGEQPGLLRLAEDGTLFLDEVDSLPHGSQAVLLRVLQDRHYRPLGSRTEHVANVRIIAASNRSLDQLVAVGEFRSDLFYRLKACEVDVPPLRARGTDTELLARHFLRECARRYALPEKNLSRQTLDWFRRYGWPGNVRELENLIQHEYLVSESAELQIQAPTELASEEIQSVVTCTMLKTSVVVEPYAAARARALDEFNRFYLQQLLASVNGNVTQAAQRAGKERRALGKLIKRYGVVLPSRK